MSKSSFSSQGFVQRFHQFYFRLLMTSDYHLGYALSILYHERLLTEVYQNNPDLTTIVGIYGSRGIKHGNAVFQCQAAARTNLRFIALRQSHT